MKPSSMLFLTCAAILIYSAVRHSDPAAALTGLLFGFGTLAACAGR